MAKFGNVQFGEGIRGYGKIVYSPLPTTALLLDGNHCLSLDAPALNPGSNNFGVDALLSIDPSVADSECWIAGKGLADLSGAAGWHFYYKPGTQQLCLRLNDGGETPTVVETDLVVALGTVFWTRIQVDRGGALALFYINGALMASLDIGVVSGSLDNSEPLRVGGYDTSSHLHKGRLDMLRFDLGRVLPPAWHGEELYRILYGCPRRNQDFSVFWTFSGKSLIDISANAYELTWNGTGAPIYVDGWPGCDGVIEYLFDENYIRGMEPGYLDLDDNQRMADGSAYNYPHPNQKQTFLLEFKNIPAPQQAAFEAAWAAKQPVRLYLDTTRPQVPGTFQIVKYPLLRKLLVDRMDAELDLEQA